MADTAPEEAQQVDGRKPATKRSGKPVPVGKADHEDIEQLGFVLPDDPAYREVLAVLAGGPIPVGVDTAEGGAPAAGHGPFQQALTKHNRYHDALGRFTFGPENGGGNGGSVKDFLEPNASGLVVVATLPADIQAHLRAKTTRVFFSSDTRDTHGHHEWTAEQLQRVQTVISEGEVREDRDRHVVAAHFHEEWWLATLKVTEDRNEVLMQTFHRSNVRQVRKFRKRGKLVRDAKLR